MEKERKNIFLDEFTCMSYEYLAITAYNCNAENVYIVGDHKQTQLENGHGTNISEKIPLDNISTHTLMVNFRSRPDIVSLVNQLGEYQMEPTKETTVERNIIKIPRSLFIQDNISQYTNMAYSYNSIGQYSLTERDTVKKNQGSTHDNSVLYISAHDVDYITKLAFKIVAVSRTKEKLYIVHDESVESQALMTSMGIGDLENFYEGYEAYTMPYLEETEAKEPQIELQEVEKYLENTVETYWQPTTLDIDFEFNKFLKKCYDNNFLKIKSQPPISNETIKAFKSIKGKIFSLSAAYFNLFVENTIRGGLIFSSIVTLMGAFLMLRTFEEQYSYIEKDGKIIFKHKPLTDALEQMLKNGYDQEDIKGKINNINVLKKNIRKEILKYYEVDDKCSCCKNIIDFDIFDDEFVQTNRDSITKCVGCYYNCVDGKLRQYCQRKKDLLKISNVMIENINDVDDTQSNSTFDLDDYSENVSETEQTLPIVRNVNFVVNDLIPNTRPIFTGHTDSDITTDDDSESDAKSDTSTETTSSGSSFSSNNNHSDDSENSEDGEIEQLSDASFDVNNYSTNNNYNAGNNDGSDNDHDKVLEEEKLIINNIVVGKPMEKFVSRPKVITTTSYQENIKTVFFSPKTLFMNDIQSKNNILPPLENKSNVLSYRQRETRKDTMAINSLKAIKSNNDKFQTDNIEYIDSITTFLPANPVSYVEREVGEPEIPEERYQGSRDSHLSAADMLVNFSQDEITLQINNLEANVVPDTFNTGTLNTDILCPVNQRGHFKNLISKCYTIAAGSGLSFSKIAPFQTLQVLAGRYFNKKSKVCLSESAKDLAQEMVDLFVKEHMDIKEFQMEKIDVIVEEFYKSAKSKHYEEQYVGYDNADAGVIRFHLKDIYKPKLMSLPDVFKCGQGVSAWDKDLQIMFGAAIRVINDHFINSCCDHFVYDNKLTKQQLKDKMTENINKVPMGAQFGVTDYEMFDAQQNEVTQHIEKLMLQRLGVSEEFIDWYYTFRSKYTIQSDYTRGKCGHEKTSGEPGTLLFNTFLAAVTTNFVLRGEGPVAIGGKGDDGIKYQAKLVQDLLNAKRLSMHTNMKMKSMVSSQAEFTGYAITPEGFYESLPRKLSKILNHRIRDLEHFHQFRQSLLDFINDVKKDGILDTIVANAKTYKTSVEEQQAIFDAINSFSHLDEEGFNSVYKKKEINCYIPAVQGLVQY